MRLTDYAERLDQKRAVKLLDMLEESADEEMQLCIAELLMDGHLCEKTANHKIDKLKAPVLLSAPDKKWSTSKEYPMHDYMVAMNLTPHNSKEMVEKAQDRAREKAVALSISAPKLPSEMNMWDAYYTMAMVLSDYWYTINGDMDKASMMAYEILSDVDKDR